MARDTIQECYRRAAEARRTADGASTPSESADFLEIERRWLFLARSYEMSGDEGSDARSGVQAERSAVEDHRRYLVSGHTG
jgi:hypothetical protein